MKITIKKLGGENVAELVKSAQNILDDYHAGNLQAVIVSAMRSSEFNTTDRLIEIGKELSKKVKDEEKIFAILQDIYDFHIEILHAKCALYVQEMIPIVQKQCNILEENIRYYMSLDTHIVLPSSQNDYAISTSQGEIFSIIGLGEILSCRVFSHVIDKMFGEGVCSKSINLSCLLQSSETQQKSHDEIFQLLSKKLSLLVVKKIEDKKIPIFSGYIGVFENGIESAIGRGYSDATAAVCTVGLAALGYEVVLEIQKSVKGVLSADPRMLYNPENARLIKELDYLMAREITGDGGANAKLLHSQAIRQEVQDAGVKIHLFDPFGETKSGTWILPSTQDTEKGEPMNFFIGGRKNIVFFSISSGKMFQSGLLATIFTIVAKYFSVDIVSTSETEVTFTVDGNNDIQKKLDIMTQELKIACGIHENTDMEFVRYASNKSLIFCIGGHMRNKVGLMAQATQSLAQNNINIEIASQGRLQRAMVFGIEQENMQKAINVLHETFVS